MSKEKKNKVRTRVIVGNQKQVAAQVNEMDDEYDIIEVRNITSPGSSATMLVVDYIEEA